VNNWNWEITKENDRKRQRRLLKATKKNDFNSMLNVLDKYIKKKRERKQDV
jgi:hypothetical protein